MRGIWGTRLESTAGAVQCMCKTESKLSSQRPSVLHDYPGPRSRCALYVSVPCLRWEQHEVLWALAQEHLGLRPGEMRGCSGSTLVVGAVFGGLK